ncbi:MAG: hypothetical protein ABWK01_07150 [Infirmifilum sp.]
MSTLYQHPGPLTPNGVYIYSAEKGGWILLDQPWPSDNGVYVIYFDNTRCPACRKFDKTWFSFVEKNAKQGKDAYFIIALCDWFARQCSAEPARKLFECFDVHVSPTVVFLVREDGRVKRSLKHEGVMTLDRLAMAFIVITSVV